MKQAEAFIKAFDEANVDKELKTSQELMQSIENCITKNAPVVDHHNDDKLEQATIITRKKLESSYGKICKLNKQLKQVIYLKFLIPMDQ